jgi:hypothetical protein
MYFVKKSLAIILAAAMLLTVLPAAGVSEAIGEPRQSPGAPSGEPVDTEQAAPAAPEETPDMTSPLPEPTGTAEIAADGASFDSALTLSLNQTAHGQITGELPGIYYSLTIARGDDYTISSGGDLPLHADLLSADRVRIAAFKPDTDITGGEPAIFAETIHLDKGVYYLYAESAAPGMTGAYTLTATRFISPEATEFAQSPEPAIVPDSPLATPEILPYTTLETVSAPEPAPAATAETTDEPVVPTMPVPDLTVTPAALPEIPMADTPESTAAIKHVRETSTFTGPLIAIGSSGGRIPDNAKMMKGVTRYPESDHPYADNADEYWYYAEPDATGYTITFSSDTWLEAGYDYLYFYDENMNRIQFTDSYGYITDSFTGSQLSGRKLTMACKGFYVELVTDVNLNLYGFRFTDIVPSYPESDLPMIYTCEQSGAAGARVTWNKVTLATGYRLYRAASQYGAYSYIKSTLDTFATASGLSAGRSYWFKVRPYKVSNMGTSYLSYSNAAQVIILSRPVITDAAISGENTALIQWNAVPDADGYFLYRSDKLYGTYAAVAVVDTPYCTNNGLTQNQPYYYKVAAYRVYSTTVIGALSAASPMVKYIVPVITYVRQYGTTGAQIAWTGVSASGYEVFRSDAENGTYSYIKAATGTRTFDYNLTPGAFCWYKIRFYKTIGGVRNYSVYSSPVSVQILAAPIITSAERTTSSSALIVWGAVGGASGYSLYRATSVNGTYALIKSVQGTSVYDTGLSTRTYYYKVAAYVRYGSTKVYGIKSEAVPVTVSTTPDVAYRALVIGQSNYQYMATLHGAADGANLSSLLSRLAMDGQTYQTTVKSNQTAAQILSDIPAAFAGADSNDVSLFFYSGHGNESTGTAAGSLYGVDSGPVTPSQLKNALDNVPGTVIVLIDSCGSGAYIYDNNTKKTAAIPLTKEDADTFTNAFISAFYSPTLKTGELLTGKYQVLAACEYGTYSYETSQGGFFTNALCKAGGWDPINHIRLNLLGDSNSDSTVTLQEGYSYVYNHTNLSYQVVQIYPLGSAYPLFCR